MDLSQWPDVRADLLEKMNVERYRERKHAMELYVGGVSPEKIQIQTHVHRSDLGKLLDRCLATHRDGRIYGFRACIPGIRILEYNRKKSPPDPKLGNNRGYAGSFRQFLNAHPDIEKALKALYLNRAKIVGLGQEVRISIQSAKKRFDKLCRSEGVKSNQYPLNTEDGGRESLRRFLRNLHDSYYVAAVNAQGDVDARVAIAGSVSAALDKEPLNAFEETEMDGHTIDLEVELELWIPTPSGVESPVILGRLTLLVLVDVASTAILAYQVVLHRNYNTTDVMLCLSRSFEPWRPMEITIPGLEYLPGAGLPSGVITECEGGACWDVLHWDNHRTQISPFTCKTVQDTVKCVINQGKHMTPLARALVEQTFGQLEKQLHRLPGTTGSHPRDPLRTKQKHKNILHLRLHEFLQVLDVLICNHNAQPHRRGFGLTPNEFIRASIDQGRIIVRNLSEVEAQDCSLLKIRRRCSVRGNFKKSKRPYIEFKYARYSSSQLANMPSLIGKELNVEFRRNDMRICKAYDLNGALFGNLTVERLWSTTEHTLEQRVLIARMIKQKKLDLQAHPDPIHAAVDYLSVRAPISRAAASQYANLTARDGKPYGTSIHSSAPTTEIPKKLTVTPWQPNPKRWIKLTKR